MGRERSSMARVADDERGRRNIVVIGAAAGGAESRARFVRCRPSTFGGAVFVVVHLPEGSFTALPQILEREGALPVAAASGGARVELGTITVARPDHLLML